MRRRPSRGFTLFELVVLVIVIAIVAIMVVPDGGSRSSARLASAANILAADFEYCQSACIANPARQVGVMFDLQHNQYSLAPIASPSTPIKRPDDSSQNYSNDLSTGRFSALQGVQIASVNGAATAITITFDAYGRPLGAGSGGVTYALSGDVTVVLSSGSDQLKVVVDHATGDVSIQK